MYVKLLKQTLKHGLNAKMYMLSQNLNKQDGQSCIIDKQVISEPLQKVILKKDTIKRLSNSVFGKTIQNEMDERDLRIAMNGKIKDKHASSIYFKEINFISEHLKMIKKVE